MRYIEVRGEIKDNNQLILHESLSEIKPQRVEIDIIFDDGEEYREPTKEEILDGIAEGYGQCLRGEFSSGSDLEKGKTEATGEINEQGQLILDRPLPDIQFQYVDVVIWFIKDEEWINKFYDSEENVYEEHPVIVRELIGSRI